MRLKVVGSGSAGNAYIIYNETETLLIECGVQFSKIKQALNFDLSKVVGCLISHSHQDHCKSALDVSRAGLQIYCSEQTEKAMGFYSHRIANIQAEKQFKVGNFKILPFSLQHDVPTLGFFINHPETGNFVFLTDTFYCKYSFPGLNNIIVEANYSDEILEERRQRGGVVDFLRDRVIRSHMSLKTCKDFLKANDLGGVNNILLIHLSDGNSNAKQFQREVEDLTGKNVMIAESGLDIPFDATPF